MGKKKRSDDTEHKTIVDEEILEINNDVDQSVGEMDEVENANFSFNKNPR